MRFANRFVLAVLLTVLGCGSASAQALDVPAPSIGAVAREIPRDLWKFFSWDTAIVLGVGGGAALIGHTWDDDLSGELETNVSLNNAMEPGHTYGAFSSQVLIGIGMYTGGRWPARGGSHVLAPTSCGRSS